MVYMLREESRKNKRSWAHLKKKCLAMGVGDWVRMNAIDKCMKVHVQ